MRNFLKREFKKELKALLEKYNANIGFKCGEVSGTYIIYDSKMIVHTNNKE